MFSDRGSPPGFFRRRPAVGRQHLKGGHQIADTHCVLPPGDTLWEPAKVQITLLIRIHKPSERKPFSAQFLLEGPELKLRQGSEGKKCCTVTIFQPPLRGGVREPESVLLRPFSRIEITVF